MTQTESTASLVHARNKTEAELCVGLSIDYSLNALRKTPLCFVWQSVIPKHTFLYCVSAQSKKVFSREESTSKFNSKDPGLSKSDNLHS